MSKFKFLICQCSPYGKIVDAEKTQQIEYYLIESFKAYAEAERQKKISDELGEKAIDLIISEDIEIEKLLIQIKKKVVEDGN